MSDNERWCFKKASGSDSCKEQKTMKKCKFEGRKNQMYYIRGLQGKGYWAYVSGKISKLLRFFRESRLLR